MIGVWHCSYNIIGLLIHSDLDDCLKRVSVTHTLIIRELSSTVEMLNSCSWLVSYQTLIPKGRGSLVQLHKESHYGLQLA